MNKKFVKIIALALALVFLVPTGVSAASFKDVPNSHWAHRYIDVLSDEGIIEGYPGGEYKPNSYVAFLEVLKLIYGVMDPAKDEVVKAVAAHKDLMTTEKVPLWAQEAVATALEREVITESLLKEAHNKGMFGEKVTTVPDRNLVSEMLAKGLAMEPETDFSVLKYKDIDEVPLTAKKYLVPLVKSGIFAATGSDGNFFGKRGIRRSEMAKVVYYSYEYQRTVVKDVVVEGVVNLVSDTVGASLFSIETGKDASLKTIVFNLNNATTFSHDGKVASLKDLAVGQRVKVTYAPKGTSDPETAKSVEITTTTVDGVGYVQDIYKTEGTDEKSIKVKYADKKAANLNSPVPVKTDEEGLFLLKKDLKITAYDRILDVKEIRKNDLVEFKAEDGVISSLKVYPEKTSVIGEVTGKAVDTPSKGLVEVTVKLSDKKEYKFYGTTVDYKYEASTDANGYISLTDLQKYEDATDTYLVDKTGVNKLEKGQYVNLNLNYKMILSTGVEKREGYVFGEVRALSKGGVAKSLEKAPVRFGEYADKLEVKVEGETGTKVYPVASDALLSGGGWESQIFAAGDTNIKGKMVTLQIKEGVVQNVALLEGSNQVPFKAEFQVTEIKGVKFSSSQYHLVAKVLDIEDLEGKDITKPVKAGDSLEVTIVSKDDLKEKDVVLLKGFVSSDSKGKPSLVVYDVTKK